MPIYEYRCEDCGKKSTFITLAVSQSFDLKCQACGGARLRKLVSRVAVQRSEESRLDRMSDPSALDGLDENDPQAMGRWMKKMGREMGEDLGGEEELAGEGEEDGSSGGGPEDA